MVSDSYHQLTLAEEKSPCSSGGASRKAQEIDWKHSKETNKEHYKAGHG